LAEHGLKLLFVSAGSHIHSLYFEATQKLGCYEGPSCRCVANLYSC